jgi:hypothetical protein
MRSKGWGFRKVRSAFPYFLFLVSYSLFPCVFAPLRTLRETMKKFKRFNEFKRLGNSRLPMLVFSPIIKVGKILMKQNPLPYSLFLIPYWLFNASSPTVETVGYRKHLKV